MNRSKCIMGGVLLLLLHAGCDDLSYFTEKTAREQTLRFFPELNSIDQIGVTTVSQDEHNHWFVTYNNSPVQHPRVYLFHRENPTEVAHLIDLKHKYTANIEKVYFEDATNNGEYELILELHYDYQLAYQARELVVYQHPFDEEKKREIFNFVFEEVREKIEGFDDEYSLPVHRVEVENHCDFSFYEGYIVFKGTIAGNKNHLLRFRWDAPLNAFKLDRDENLHEADEEEKYGGIVHKVRGSKVLKPVNSHEHGCLSFMLEDVEHHVLDIGQDIHDALLCSPVTSLSPDGRFLVFTDRKRQQLVLLDFNTNHRYTLCESIHVYEGISEVVWTSNSRRLGLILINPEEFVEHTAVVIAEVDKTDKIHRHLYPRRVYYDCTEGESCLPVREYDYRFDKQGFFRYRSQKSQTELKDYDIVK